MSAKSAGPRERLIEAAIDLVREKGVEGAGLSELLERSSSARRSLYQHFPGGKDELIAASTGRFGTTTRDAILGVVGVLDARALVDVMVGLIRDGMVETEFRYSCPIAAAAYAPADSDVVRRAAGAAFDDWIGAVEAVLLEEGRSAEEARSLAGFLVAGVEGALILARAARSTEPLDRAAEQLKRLL